MNLEGLLKNKMIESIETDDKLVKKSVNSASRDLKTAKVVLENENYDWSLAIAYNAMLQAGRALMFSRGYRPVGEYKHVAVVEFVHSEFGKEITNNMVDIFNRLRKKRHKVIYEEVDIVTPSEAENAIKFAEEFVNKVKSILKI
jgi:uncharacterized protein (UPF0332 family)